MLDIAWSELLVIAVVALVIIGPKDLPKAIYTLGKWVRKARIVAREFQGHLDDMMRESELDELRQQALKTRDMNIQKMVENTVDPKGDLRNAFDVGLTGHPDGSSEETSLPPKPATEPPVTTPVASPVAAAMPPAPPTEFIPSPAPAPAPAPEPVSAQTTTNKQA